MSEWQSIETAPEETAVLIYDPDWDPPVAVGYYANESNENQWEMEWSESGEVLFAPTHWMPLPGRPSEG